eukprot:4298151-Amphidinium_carterae.1
MPTHRTRISLILGSKVLQVYLENPLEPQALLNLTNTIEMYNNSVDPHVLHFSVELRWWKRVTLHRHHL